MLWPSTSWRPWLSCRHVQRPFVLNASAETNPTQCDYHFWAIAEHGRMVWQKASGLMPGLERRVR
jgi:hypothetical protein